MSRGRKLLIVGFVLVVGIGLAWPFRKTGADRNFETVANMPSLDLGVAKMLAAQQPVGRLARKPTRQQPARRRPTGQRPLEMRPPVPPVKARMADMRETQVGRPRSLQQSSAPVASFDLANHPALATPLTRPSVSPITPPQPPQIAAKAPVVDETNFLPGFPHGIEPGQPDARLVYSTTNRDLATQAAEEEEEVRHVVQNSDTLEKIAKRYLGDEGRALEIFDLNRDLLDNPHLLPIHAELRLPADSRKLDD